MKREAEEEEEEDGGPETLTLAPPTPAAPPGIPIPPPPARTTGMPIREDCWSEEASCTLVSAWGERYLELNRGNLRQKHWQSVADTVNNRHAAANSNNHPNKNFKSRRTDVQCKNRIDTLKKKYKLEKARVMSSNGSYRSNWALYDQLDALIGSSVQTTKKMMAVSSSSSPQRTTTTTQLALPYYQQQQRRVQPNSSVVVPLRGGGGDRQKRSAASSGAGGGYGQGIHTEIDESFFRRNYSAVAAAAAAAAADDVGGNSDSSRSSGESDRREGDGFGELAKAISKFADIFERVEGARQRQMLELEKERMEFIKSLEYQRMQLFMDSQVQIEKIKRAKHDAPAASD